MYQSIQLTNTTPFAKSSGHRPQWRLGFRLIVLVFASFALSPAAWAVSPPPVGGYPGQNTATGDNALFSLTTGTDNTAIGFNALFNNTTGNNNTATGNQTLALNTTGVANTAIGFDALFHNTTGGDNTAIGYNALTSNSTGGSNTAIGYSALLATQASTTRPPVLMRS